ncbi:hypothetical protein BS614_10680 [Paenibacillus xylanexedens]|nr:hypothetical protein BS614_10680 [Paenibacillus xylanexedens]
MLEIFEVSSGVEISILKCLEAQAFIPWGKGAIFQGTQDALFRLQLFFLQSKEHQTRYLLESLTKTLQTTVLF